MIGSVAVIIGIVCVSGAMAVVPVVLSVSFENKEPKVTFQHFTMLVFYYVFVI